MRVVADDELCVLVGPWFLGELSTQLFKSTRASVVALTTGNRWVHLILQMQSVFRWGGELFTRQQRPSRDMMIWHRNGHVHVANATEYFAASVARTFVSLPFPERRFHTEWKLDGAEEVVGATASNGTTRDGGCLGSGNFLFVGCGWVICVGTLFKSSSFHLAGSKSVETPSLVNFVA